MIVVDSSARARHGPTGAARLWRLLEDSEVEIVA